MVLRRVGVSAVRDKSSPSLTCDGTAGNIRFIRQRDRQITARGFLHFCAKDMLYDKQCNVRCKWLPLGHETKEEEANARFLGPGVTRRDDQQHARVSPYDATPALSQPYNSAPRAEERSLHSCKAAKLCGRSRVGSAPTFCAPQRMCMYFPIVRAPYANHDTPNARSQDSCAVTSMFQMLRSKTLPGGRRLTES